VTCTDIPQLLATDPRKDGCKRVAEAYPDCACEDESVCPNISPRTVSPDETIMRFVMREHWDEEQKAATPAAFSHAGTVGMSVTRGGQCTPEQLAWQERSRDQDRAINRDYVGYLVARTGDVRHLRVADKQGFAVYDTALETNRAHADVCQAVLGPRSQASELRRSLQRLFSSSGLCTARTL
jgi:hypothetical protein